MPKKNKSDKQNDKFDQHDDKLHAGDYDTYFGNLDQSSTKDGAGPSNDVNVGTGNTAASYNVFVNHPVIVSNSLKTL